jgi:hypothetical protein
VPKLIEANRESKVNILCNQQAQEDRTIANNKPHTIIRNNERGTCMLIDVAISGDRYDQDSSREDSKTLQ